MKIALIGNMNNANFSILRYLHDLGHDAQLFLYENDAANENAHFHWKNDTWEAEKWKKQIIKTRIRNSSAQILSGKFSWHLFFSFLQKTIKLFGSKGEFFHPGIKNVGNYLNSNFKGYDIIIGSGNTPALFTYCQTLKLNIFYPYSNGVEYVNVVNQLHKKMSLRNIVLRVLIHLAKKVQIQGLVKKTDLVYNAEMGFTNKTLLSFNCNVKNSFIPAVYVESNITIKKPHLTKIIETINSIDFTILMHSRHKWDDKSIHDLEWETNENKNNDWLIKAYSEFIKNHPSSNSKLIMMNYGENVNESRQLVKKLGLFENVTWIQKMPRKELLEIIKNVDLVAGEFYKAEKMIWGGTGWEAFACGKPFLNSFRFDSDSFQNIFGIPEPIILKSNSIDELYNSIKQAYLNPNSLIEIGKKNHEWFKKYNGLNKTKEWINYYLTRK